MKSLLLTSVNLFAIFLSAQAADPPTCLLADNLCATCDGGNLTDTTGSDWAVSCGWSIVAASQEAVEGDPTPAGCTDACNDSNDCWAVNIAANGSCNLITGQSRGITRQNGYTVLVRFADLDEEPDATSTPPVHINATISGPGVTRTFRPSITSTTEMVPSSAFESSSRCDLQLTNLCPKCDGEEVSSEQGKLYQIRCDQDLSSSSSYSPQEWMSPSDCLNECEKYDWCKGTMYYDDRNCEIARGEDVFAVSKTDYTAFLPLATKIRTVSSKTSSSASRTLSRAWNITKASSSAEPTFSILPIDSDCNLTSLSCPACDGVPYDDRLNGSYTVMCGVTPDCVSVAQSQDGATDQEQCLQGCDQDVTCLAAMWYPQSSACHLCQQGMELGDRTRATLPYVLLVANMDETENEPMATTTPRSTIYPGATTTRTPVPSTSHTITNFPQPFSASDADAADPVGPVSASLLPSVTGLNPEGPFMSVTTSTNPVLNLSSSSMPATVTEVAAVSCPASNHGMYVLPDSGNYFGIECDQVFAAAHSRYVTASDFAACAASCTGQCDGIQFGYSSRCGLYTDISVIGPANGWTVGASITFPPSATMTPPVTVAL